jgi:acylphosphatase
MAAHDAMSGAPSGRTRVAATVHGRVQGVGFRHFVIVTARRLEVDGWVANAPDGTVRCEIEGEGSAVAQLVRELESGPMGAYVERVDLAPRIPTGVAGRFEIHSFGHSGD